MCYYFIANNSYMKTVYDRSCIFLVTRKDVTFEFLKDEISFENMVCYFL